MSLFYRMFLRIKLLGQRIKTILRFLAPYGLLSEGFILNYILIIICFPISLPALAVTIKQLCKYNRQWCYFPSVGNSPPPPPPPFWLPEFFTV